MKVLFLDFDGVLNNKQHMLATKDVPKVDANTVADADLFNMKRDIASQNIWVLGYILNKVPDLQIVISSSWRLFYDLESFKELFRIFNLDSARIISKTPKKLSSDRHNEVHWWVEDMESLLHKDIDWVVLDDHPVFNLEDADKCREFLTDNWTGLTMHDAFKIIKYFKPDYVEPMLGI